MNLIIRVKLTTISFSRVPLLAQIVEVYNTIESFK